MSFGPLSASPAGFARQKEDSMSDATSGGDLTHRAAAPARNYICDRDYQVNESLQWAYGELLDYVILGPAPGFGNKFPISTFDAKIVAGDRPTICPKADRKPPPEILPIILGVFLRVGMVKAGQTIHWVGSQSKIGNLCTCFMADTGLLVATTTEAVNAKPGRTPHGNGESADDLTDFETAKDIRTKHTPAGVVLDQRRLVKFLNLHSDIRQRRPQGKNGEPRKNRLLVHLADWYKHRDALVEWDTADRNSMDNTSESEIAERTAAVHRKKNRRK